jgi:dipeptidyl aminopeptidase/acylaminoacyl peptidase
MHSRIRTLCVLPALLLALAVAAPALPQEKAAAPKAEAARSQDGKRLFSAMDALRVKGVGAPRISPDGARIVYAVSETQMEKDKEWKSVTHLWTVPVSGGAPRQFTRGEKNATSPSWSPDGKHIAFLTNREKDSEQQVWMMWADGGEAWQVTTHKGGVRSFQFSPDGKSLLLTATDQPSKEEEERKKLKDDTILIDQDHKMTHLWLWDLDKKEAKRLTEGSFTVSDPRFSPDGKQVTFTTNPTPKADDNSLTDAWVLTIATGEKRKLSETPRHTQNARWSPDGNWIAFTGRDASAGVTQTHLYVIPASGGAPRNLTATFALDAGAPVWSQDGRRLFFSSNTLQAVEIFAADVEPGAVRQLTRLGGAINVAEISRDGRTLVGTMTGAQHPGEVYRADAGFRSVERLTDHNAWLREYALGAVETVKWKSRDGLEIEGVLTRPVDFDAAKKYPLLLNPHGGPTGASLATFNSTNQLLAANGYLVLQPNFRGSTGKGVEFAAMNRNDWGKGDYEDCITGVEAILARGWADRDRLGAFGWSYGGYMTFWLLTQTDMFKAVSPGAGLTNIYSMYSQNDIQRYLRWFYNDESPWENPERYWDHSPMKHVKNVKTPTLILHGQNDVRVPIAQAQEFYRALVEMNVPVEFAVYPRAGHGLTEPRHQLDRLKRYLNFFGKYLNQPAVTERAEDRD